MKLKKEENLGKLWELNSVWDVLTDEEKNAIEDVVEVVHYRKNDLIHSEGDIPTHVMMLVSGKVRIYKEGIGQRQQIIRLLKPYDFFSYRAVVAGDSYSSCASAFEECVIYQVERDYFMQLLQQNTRFCFQMLSLMAGDLGLSELQTVNLTQKHIRGRLAESLISLKENYGTDDDEVTIAMYMSREDLANMSNMTTSNAIRTLSQFAAEGLIGVDGRKIKILNEVELRKISRLG